MSAPFDLHESFLGAMLGLAAGDALGAAVENLTYAEILARFPTGLSTYHTGVAGSLLAGLPAGTYTVMVLGIGDAYVSAGGVLDLDRVAHNWIGWKQVGPYGELGPGVACNTAIDRLIAGASPQRSGVEGSAGNGTAMRVTPIGLLRWADPLACTHDAISQSRITHVHPEADAGAA